MKFSPRWITLGSAAAFGVIAAAGVHYYIADRIAAIEALSTRTEVVKQVVANQDMPRGAKLTTDSVSVRAIPREWAYADALTPDQLNRFNNAALEVAAHRGQPILWAQLAAQGPRALSDRIEPGRRAVTVPVDDISSVSGLVTPGDRIDLLVSIKHDTRTLLMPVLQRTLVLATGTRTDSRPSPESATEARGYNTMTLDVSPEDARRIFAARELGRLTAVLRTSSDEENPPMRNEDAQSILGLLPRAGASLAVRVIYADQLPGNSKPGVTSRRMP